MNSSNKPYDLGERISLLGESTIQFLKKLKSDLISQPILSQLVRSSTSIGANYMEALGASSRRDFRNKIYICKKEAQETKHWLRMLAQCYPGEKDSIRTIWKETHEINLILEKTCQTLLKNDQKKVDK